MRALLATTAAVLLLAAPATASPPRAGLVVPGTSLGGIRLGATQAQVRAVWGAGYGRCRGCVLPTWYFTYRPFTQQGTGVGFLGGNVTELYTLWSPPGWRTPSGLTIGDPAARVTALYGPLPRFQCIGYAALPLNHGRTITVFYLVQERVWGFALMRAGLGPCP